MAVQMERNAILQYVAEQLAELNALLRAAGFASAPPPVAMSPFTQPAPGYQQGYQSLPPQGAQAAPASRPCTWCGHPGTPTNVGNGLIQDLCVVHARAQRAEARGPNGEYANAAAQGFGVNQTDARPSPPPNPNVGKIIMQPTEQDARAARQHEQEVVNGAVTPKGFEEIGDE
jgi:hypothetical protein